MASGGPMACLARQAVDEAVVCDLRIVDETDPRELIVEPVVGEASDAKSGLSEWVQALGYGRIWFPDGPIDLDLSDPCGQMGTKCDVCETEWVDGSAGFWKHSSRMGCFPAFCWVCGSLMAQWQPWTCGGEEPHPGGERDEFAAPRRRPGHQELRGVER
jgi:hypothetical protein